MKRPYRITLDPVDGIDRADVIFSNLPNGRIFPVYGRDALLKAQQREGQRLRGLVIRVASRQELEALIADIEIVKGHPLI